MKSYLKILNDLIFLFKIYKNVLVELFKVIMWLDFLFKILEEFHLMLFYLVGFQFLIRRGGR